MNNIPNDNQDIVSFDSEPLILVDSEDQVTGYLDKLQCHLGEGKLHRAFSLFIFNSQGELLIQQRSANKLLWPLYWSNSCCSHPRQGESMEVATQRRLQQELGIQSSLEYLYRFQYQAHFGNIGSEHELCSVFVGQTDQPIQANSNEIADWRFIIADNLSEELKQSPETFTPWFKMEWEKLTQHFLDALQQRQVTLSSEG